MPLSFFHEFESVSSFSVSKPNVQLERLLEYLGKKAVEIRSNPDQEYNLLLKVETRFVKSSIEDTLIVKTVRNKNEADNPNLVQEVILTEEDITEKFSWTSKELGKRLKIRYPLFKRDKAFNDLIRELKSDNALCHVRLLNPLNIKSQKTFFYSPNCIQNYFDQHYKVGTATPQKVGLVEEVGN